MDDKIRFEKPKSMRLTEDEARLIKRMREIAQTTYLHGENVDVDYTQHEKWNNQNRRVRIKIEPVHAPYEWKMAGN